MTMMTRFSRRGRLSGATKRLSWHGFGKQGKKRRKEQQYLEGGGWAWRLCWRGELWGGGKGGEDWFFDVSTVLDYDVGVIITSLQHNQGDSVTGVCPCCRRLRPASASQRVISQYGKDKRGRTGTATGDTRGGGGASGPPVF